MTKLILLLLTACASSQPVLGPDGTTHQLIYCNDLKDCYKEATKICPSKKYKISNSTGIVREGVKEYDLLIKCQAK